MDDYTTYKPSELIIDKKYRWTCSLGKFTCQRFDEKPREIADKAVLSLFFHALELQEKVQALEMQIADSYRSEDLPDLVESGEEADERDE